MIVSNEFLKIKGNDLTKGKIKIDIYKDKEKTFEEMANLMVDTIIENNKNNKKTLFIVPLGPVGQYKYFAKRVNEEKVSLKNVTFINMDEYMEDENTIVDITHPLSFERQMYELCYNKIDKELLMDKSQRIFPNLENKDLITKVIEEHNGVDICFGGIGITGHVAFNEPIEGISESEFKNLSTRVLKIAKETLVVNSMDDFDGCYELVPKYAITIGFKEILSSKKIRLYCFRNWHKSVVKRASFLPKDVNFPVSLLQDHEDTRIGISEELAE